MPRTETKFCASRLHTAPTAPNNNPLWVETERVRKAAYAAANPGRIKDSRDAYAANRRAVRELIFSRSHPPIA
jgi:hypothetical protein